MAEGGIRPRRQRNNAVAEQKRLVHIVGDKDDGFAFALPQVGDFALQRAAGQRVQGAQGFIQQ